MPFFKERNSFSHIPVKEAMRRNPARVVIDSTISDVIRQMIRLKSNALLVEDPAGIPVGVVSRTDIIGAYYATLPVTSPLADIAAGPPLCCYPDDRIEEAINTMKQNGIHQLFVQGASQEDIIGVITYHDIVGLLYKYCKGCLQSRSENSLKPHGHGSQLKVVDVMTPHTDVCHKRDTIVTVMDILSNLGVSAVLIIGEEKKPEGVISKTDLAIAYAHKTPLLNPAETIMNSPVATIDSSEDLVAAIRKMLASDIRRLFVKNPDTGSILGVLSLSDSARFRSGTCKACTASRIL